METFINAPPAPVTEDQFITVGEIAFLTGYKRGSVERWRIRYPQGSEQEFPLPDDRFGDTPVWRINRVIAWLDAHGHPHNVKAWLKARDKGQFHRWANR